MAGMMLTDVDGLADAIRREHEAAGNAARSALDHALEAGRLLARAREGIPHGGWESFVRDRCGVAPRTARLYLQLDANRERLADRQRVAGLTVREAAQVLAEPKPKPLALEVAEEPSLCGTIPAWYRAGHFHYGGHPSGWIFHVWPHPAGEPWVHAVTLEPLGTVYGDMVAAGPKRGVRIDFVLRTIGLQVVNKMPPLTDPGWEISASPVDAEVIAGEPHHNRWLFLDDDDYRRNGLGIGRARGDGSPAIPG